MLVGIGFGFILAAAGLLLGFGFADPASAVSLVNPNSGLGLASNDLIDTVIAVVRWILGLVALVAVIMIIYGGYVWMTAGGDSAAVERAKKIILNAVIGLVVTLLSFAITFFIINLVFPGQPQIPLSIYCSTSVNNSILNYLVSLFIISHYIITVKK